MTPEEKVNQDVWWILQEIKKDEFLTPKGERVEFLVRVLPKTRSIKRKDNSYNFPGEDTQRKLLYKLKEWEAIDDLETIDDGWRGDIFNPKIYKLSIKQPKFDEIYEKFKKLNGENDEFFNEERKIVKVKTKNNIPQGLRDNRASSEVLEDLCFKLYKAVAKNSNNPSKETTCILYLKEIWEDVSKEEEALSVLKKEGAIDDYRIYNEIVIDNGNWDEDLGASIPEEYDILNAECKLEPAKTTTYLESIYEPKRLLYSKLAQHCLSLINILEIYFKKPTHDEKLNHFYLQICEKIESIALDNDISPELEIFNPELKIHRWKPFDNLFSAQREIKEKGASIEKILNDLNSFYGKIQNFVYKYTLQKKTENIIEELGEYLNKLKNPKEAMAHLKTLPTKIEITAMPEVPVRFVGDNTPIKGKKQEPSIELSLPEPVQWEKVTLKIKEGRQEVEISYDKNHIIVADYIRLGFFSGKRQQKPDRRWGFLCALTTLAATDIKQATVENMRTMITQGKMLSANNVQQVKKSFVERLQNIFKTHDDPFRERRDYYEPKFTILSEPALRHEEVWPQGGQLNENRGDETDRLAYEEKRIQEEREEETL